MFTVNIKKKSKTVYQQSLTTRRPKSKGLKFWNMAYHGEQGTYYALYPQSWTKYNLPGQNVKLTCHQISPIIPHNYKDSSLPVALFDWTVENDNNEDIEVSLMFTWQSGSSGKKFELKDVKSESFKHLNYEENVSGVVLSQQFRNMDLEYCLGVKNVNLKQKFIKKLIIIIKFFQENCEVTYDCQFYPEDEDSGFKLWLDLLEDGRLNNKNCKN